MGLILDTCVFIRAEKQGISTDFNHWSKLGSAYIAAITASELLVGVYRADTEARKIKRTAFVEAILANIPILNFTLEIARIHAELFAYLRKQGQEIGAHDLLIAATAIAHDYELLTYNRSEFQRVPALKLIDIA